jgi:hypothetical protein
MRWIVCALALLLAGCGKEPGFSLSKMTASLPYREKWEAEIPKELLEEACRQKFHFFSAGYQSYAFISEDERIIIKFFRMKRLSATLWNRLIHPKRAKANQENLELIFNGYKLAYEEMRQDAGLLCIHLNQTKDLCKKLTIVDQGGKEHRIDLDTVYFVVQEKAEPLFSYLHKRVGDRAELNRAVEAFLALVKRRHARGIADDDQGIAENYGFVDGRPIQFDIGRIHKGSFEGEYEEILRRLHWWMHLNNL